MSHVPAASDALRSELPPLRGKVSELGAISGPKVWWTPLSLSLVLALLGLVPRIYEHSVLRMSVWSAAGLLILWQFALKRWIDRQADAPRSSHIVLRAQHYIQAPCHLSVYLFWGYFWRPVYDHAWLILAQLVFAYAFDILLSWSRRRTYLFGFGVFPIVFSTNLFLWFRDDWFYLQFLLIAVGFMGKEFVRWTRDGKSVHIFNPSAFPLAIFSIVFILTGTTELTWGPEIASTLTLAPSIYFFLFSIGLVVMYFFAVTPVAALVAATLFGLSAAYRAITGVPYFLDSEIPAAVFLGLHFLVTDPSTSPRAPLGRALFGVLYGVGVFALYGGLGAIGAPRFYDKLMCVPLLNLMVNHIDRWALAIRLRAPGLSQPAWLGYNNVHMAVWIVFFLSMTALGKTDGRHIGDSVPFWEQACREARPHACERLLKIETTYCSDRSAWACNELGAHYAVGRLVPRDLERARQYFSLSCELRFAAACANLLDERHIEHAPPKLLDLRLLLREGGRNLNGMSEADLLERACDHGWRFACERARRAP